MHTNRHSNNGLFLTELIVNLFFFTILLVISLELFIKADTISVDASVLHEAVVQTESAAAYFEASSDLSLLEEHYPEATEEDGILSIYYDKDFSPVAESEEAYTLTVTLEADGGLTKAYLSFLGEEDAIYELTASTYTPLEVR